MCGSRAMDPCKRRIFLLPFDTHSHNQHQSRYFFAFFRHSSVQSFIHSINHIPIVHHQHPPLILNDIQQHSLSTHNTAHTPPLSFSHSHSHSHAHPIFIVSLSHQHKDSQKKERIHNGHILGSIRRGVCPNRKTPHRILDQSNLTVLTRVISQRQ